MRRVADVYYVGSLSLAEGVLHVYSPRFLIRIHIQFLTPFSLCRYSFRPDRKKGSHIIMNALDAISAYQPASGSPMITPLEKDISLGASDESSDSSSQTTSFAESVKGFLSQVNDQITTANQQTQNLMVGKTHDTGAVVASVEEANLALQMTNAIRNKILSAYQTVSQMQF